MFSCCTERCTPAETFNCPPFGWGGGGKRPTALSLNGRLLQLVVERAAAAEIEQDAAAEAKADRLVVAEAAAEAAAAVAAESVQQAAAAEAEKQAAAAAVEADRLAAAAVVEAEQQAVAAGGIRPLSEAARLTPFSVEGWSRVADGQSKLFDPCI